MLLFNVCLVSQSSRITSTRTPKNTFGNVEKIRLIATSARCTKWPRVYFQVSTVRRNWHRRLTQRTNQPLSNPTSSTKTESGHNYSRTLLAKATLTSKLASSKTLGNTLAICSTRCTRVKFRPRPVRTQRISLHLNRKRGSSV
jgi:hypothetical protein